MNKKAESFKKYLDDKKITCFTVDEIAGDNLNSVVFRSNIEINGQQLPTIVILDSSIYGMVRVLVAPRVLNDANEAGLLKELNRLNKGFKSFKYYFDDNGSLVLDCCVLLPGSEADGEAMSRGENLYLPEGITHMLPPEATGYMRRRRKSAAILLSMTSLVS